jgi:signal transduction histidine kinase
MEAVGQLTGGGAHDFNNCLAVILGRVKLLERKVGDSDHHVAEISKAARRGSELVGQLLSFSRRQPLQPAYVELPELLQNRVQLLSRIVGEATQLRTRFAPDCAAASADPAQIESAILNLVINARDATPRGGEIEVSVEKVDEHVNIADTLNVLVLEDDNHVATLLGEMLSLLGHQAAIANDPDSARAMLAADDGFQVIVSDVMLKLGATGPEFAREMQIRYPNIRAILMSGYTPEHIRHSSGLDQHSSVLQKPFTGDDLWRALNQVMSR